MIAILSQPAGCRHRRWATGFPDRIERTVELASPPETVWAALTTAEGLRSWFGDEATIDLRPGAAARVVWTAESDVGELRVERVEPPQVFGFTWPVDGMPGDGPRVAQRGLDPRAR